MYDRMQELSREELELIHGSAMEILGSVGVRFKEDEAIEIFKSRGVKTDGYVVYLTENDVAKALESVPASFTVKARNPEKNVKIGGEDFVLLPGYGAPFIIDPDKSRRTASMEDYVKFCKLIQTSPYIGMNGFMMVEPSEVPASTAHLEMLRSNILLCDKPFMGSPVSRKGAEECVEITEMVMGKDTTATVSLINSLSPLGFSEEMAGSLIALARRNQGCVVASLIMGGSSGPITLAGILAQQTAEILAGITLAQLVRPGAPVVYGSTSAPMDMMSGGLTIGAPELSQIVSFTAQLARFYNIPSRSGGGLTDANYPDIQAGAQSALALSTAVRSGINFILHSAGIVGSYLAMSFEKFLVDEELAGMLFKMMKPAEISDDEIDLPSFREVGIGGAFMIADKTVERCRTEFFTPRIMTVTDYPAWESGGRIGAVDRAERVLFERLEAWEKPDIDPGIEKDVKTYIERKA
ncbi:MAG: trimethylamine methyltransferase family protein [Spirochaetia bacterium]